MPLVCHCHSQIFEICLIFKKKTGLSNLFIYPTNAQLDCSKRMLQFTLIFTLKVLLHVSVKTTIIRELDICALLKL